MQFKLNALLITFVISTNSMGSTRKIPDNLVVHKNNIYQMGARLNSLEKELQNKYLLHQNYIGQIEVIEKDLQNYRRNISVEINNLRIAEEESKKILKNYIIEEEESSDSWQRKVHLELLKQSSKKYQDKLSQLNSFKGQVIEFENKLIVLKKDEENLQSIIRDLKDQKDKTMTNYLANIKIKKEMERSHEQSRLKKVISKVEQKFSQASIVLQKPEKIFKKPIFDFVAMNSSEKGVTFKYQAVQPILATNSGKVVFAGELASYGQVLMIDHGNDLRSVLLGKFETRVKKNDSVSVGDTLATTVMDSSEPQNLYFEIRKKNVAQNTILWLESSGVSKI